MNTSNTQSYQHQLAQFYAASGVKVFPFEFKPTGSGKLDKKPLITNYANEATCDSATLGRWWAKWPEAGVGIVCGSNRIVVLDGDRHGAGPDGVARLVSICGEHGLSLSQGSTLVATGGGGVHVYLRAPDDAEIGNASTWDADGVNVRGGGGWLVAPGNVAPDGRRWTPIVDGQPATSQTEQHVYQEFALRISGRSATHLQTVPLKLAMLLASHRAPPTMTADVNPDCETSEAGRIAAGSYAREFQTRACDGDRNSHVNRLGFNLGRLHRDGLLSRTDALAMGEEAVIENGGDWAEHAKSFNSGFESRGKATPAPDGEAIFGAPAFRRNEAGEPVGFEVPDLPSWASCPPFAEIVAKAPSLHADPDVALGVAAGTSSLAATRYLDAPLTGDPDAKKGQPATMMLAAMLPSGRGKSAILEAITAGVRKTLEKQAATLRRSIAAAESGRKASLPKPKPKRGAPPPVAPAFSDYLDPAPFLTTNSTSAALSRAMERRQPVAGLITSELAPLFEINRGDVATADLPALIIDLWDGKKPRRERIGEESFTEHATLPVRVAVVGMVQPDSWRRNVIGAGLADRYADSGLFGRLTIVAPLPSAPATPSLEVINSEEASPFLLWEGAINAAVSDPIRFKRVALEDTNPFGPPVQAAAPGFPVPAPPGPLPCVASIGEPIAGVMRRGDELDPLLLRLAPETFTQLNHAHGELVTWHDAGYFGPPSHALRSIVLRLAQRALRLAASAHFIANHDTLRNLARDGQPNPLHPALEIPWAIMSDAWLTELRWFTLALEQTLYGPRVSGLLTRQDAKREYWNAPTKESFEHQQAARLEGAVLTFLRRFPMSSARDIHRSVRAIRDRFNGMADLKGFLDALVASEKIRVVETRPERGPAKFVYALP
jgi:hypothetical protein